MTPRAHNIAQFILGLAFSGFLWTTIYGTIRLPKMWAETYKESKNIKVADVDWPIVMLCVVLTCAMPMMTYYFGMLFWLVTSNQALK